MYYSFVQEKHFFSPEELAKILKGQDSIIFVLPKGEFNQKWFEDFKVNSDDFQGEDRAKKLWDLFTIKTLDPSLTYLKVGLTQPGWNISEKGCMYVGAAINTEDIYKCVRHLKLEYSGIDYAIGYDSRILDLMNWIDFEDEEPDKLSSYGYIFDIEIIYQDQTNSRVTVTACWDGHRKVWVVPFSGDLLNDQPHKTLDDLFGNFELKYWQPFPQPNK